MDRPLPPPGPSRAAGRLAFDPQAFRWPQVPAEVYKFATGDARGMGWRGVVRVTLAGPPAVPSVFELRYFEIASGGYSSLEKHRHPHLIVVLRGRGRALVGDRVVDLRPFDLLRVPPGVPHRWINEADEPFGFLCPVDAQRDPPQPVSDAEWEALRANPATAPYAF
ncbi:MAG: cupin domain-containing protein [Armatimonadota bacterium]|nr:cupin domain-containing protein [Armatimonadota bacterium]MDR7436071.1 cupin domain-containing protein [Armatimonadota bacterium]MDR7471950.1 cupin domain-containing protein [Armatimonadota bacterium]MDR7507042.1 cupin domain-containing protein [Armatimonadota bacterium]MDR7508606.1 cupin domain-containing protein [Armatimonadota bacterium]